MSKRRWSKFWWQDYERDPALRLCSLAAQGLWMRLLCLMHEGEPYGHLCVNHRPLHPRHLALMLGVAERQITRLMAELKEAGVFSTTAEGCVYSRRLLRDKAASDQGAAWGRTGGNPSLKAARSTPPSAPFSVQDMGAGEGLSPPHKHQEAETESEAECTLTAFGPNDDVRLHLFKHGLVFLQKATGRPERSTRALMGKWLKMLHDDAACLLAVLGECAAFKPVEPVSWVEAKVRARVAERAQPVGHTSSTHAQRLAAWQNVPDLEGV